MGHSRCCTSLKAIHQCRSQKNRPPRPVSRRNASLGDLALLHTHGVHNARALFTLKDRSFTTTSTPMLFLLAPEDSGLKLDLPLLHCKRCVDVRLVHESRTSCHCGASSARVNAPSDTIELSGEAMLLAFASESLISALQAQHLRGEAASFEVFVLSEAPPVVRIPHQP